jgi:hypothetical protein
MMSALIRQEGPRMPRWSWRVFSSALCCPPRRRRRRLRNARIVQGWCCRAVCDFRPRDVLTLPAHSAGRIACRRRSPPGPVRAGSEAGWPPARLADIVTRCDGAAPSGAKEQNPM